MFKEFGLIALFLVLLQLAAISGFVYFVFWCLRHFGVIG